MSHSRVLDIAQSLIRFNSISRASNALISEYVASLLEDQGFVVEHIGYVDEFGVPKVNLVAKRGPGAGGIMYSAHTDVVPADDWIAGPDDAFNPKCVNGKLFGRGSCDMKGSLAAALAAAEQIDARKQTAPLYFAFLPMKSWAWLVRGISQIILSFSPKWSLIKRLLSLANQQN